MAGVRKLIELARNDRQKALVAFCGMCGLRVAEATSVKPSHIDLTEMLLTVRGKGDKTRVIPISPECWEIIQQAVVVAFVEGDRSVVGMQERFARQLITNLGKRAGLQRPIASHDLRATFATAVYDSTRDQRVTQELLGHASGATTELYIQVSMNKMREAVKL
jgi:site-specific recombinase XerD